MFDKSLCKKIGKKNISLRDILDYISDTYGNSIAEFNVIGFVFLTSLLICVGARDGFLFMLIYFFIAFTIAAIITKLIMIVTKYVLVAKCPLKK